MHFWTTDVVSPGTAICALMRRDGSVVDGVDAGLKRDWLRMRDRGQECQQCEGGGNVFHGASSPDPAPRNKICE
jgi:hypothetical protein